MPKFKILLHLIGHNPVFRVSVKVIADACLSVWAWGCTSYFLNHGRIFILNNHLVLWVIC